MRCKAPCCFRWLGSFFSLSVASKQRCEISQFQIVAQRIPAHGHQTFRHQMKPKLCRQFVKYQRRKEIKICSVSYRLPCEICNADMQFLESREITLLRVYDARRISIGFGMDPERYFFMYA